MADFWPRQNKLFWGTEMCANKLLICKAQQAYIQTEPQDAEVLVSADVVQQTDVS